mgnify:CR=1 FL=1
MSELAMSAAEVRAFFDEHFPQAMKFGFEIKEVSPEGVTLLLSIHERHLRPGATVSGPTLMTLADTAAYIAVLSRVGEVALAVTTSLNINFLRRPDAKQIRAECRLLKLGRRLAVADVQMFGDKGGGPVAQASVTYSLPPR